MPPSLAQLRHDGRIAALPPILFSSGGTMDGRASDKVPMVRLARHRIRLDDGHPVGVAVAGRGMPLVVAHGFSAEGVLYAQTLWRLVSMGFKVVTIDIAGHGRTPLPRRDPMRLDSYVSVLRGSLDHLGIKRAVFMGHSMGGRMMLEVAAAEPERAVGLVLLDAIAGQQWDELVAGWMRCPLSAGLIVGRLAADTITTIPIGDRDQSAKLLSLMTKTALESIRPGRLLAPGLAIFLSAPSVQTIETLAAARVPAAVIHGGGDLAVPVAAARDAADRLSAVLVVVKGGRHCWMLRDPETLPAIFGDLLDGVLGEAWVAAVREAGVEPGLATLAQVESAMCHPRSLLAELTPPLQFTSRGPRRKAPTFRWSVHHPAVQ